MNANITLTKEELNDLLISIKYRKANTDLETSYGFRTYERLTLLEEKLYEASKNL